MAIKPKDNNIDMVDYIFENYIMPDMRFNPEIWAECSSSFTTNRCESFHSKSIRNSIFLKLLTDQNTIQNANKNS